MKKAEESKIVEEEVCFLSVTDIDPVLQGHLFRVEYNGCMYNLSIGDFIGWMYETGRIDNWSNAKDGCVWLNGYTYTYQGYVNAFKFEIDTHLIDYKRSGANMELEAIDPHAWLLDIREPAASAGEELSPDGLTRDQEESAWAEFYGLYDEAFLHPNQNR